jgi:hypothetical protein
MMCRKGPVPRRSFPWFIVRPGGRGEREGSDDVPEGARSAPLIPWFIVRRGVQGKREGPE